MNLKTRKRLAILILVVGMPLYIVAAVTAVNWMDASWGRQPIWIELIVYIALGLIWVFPFRRIFTGTGREE